MDSAHELLKGVALAVPSSGRALGWLQSGTERVNPRGESSGTAIVNGIQGFYIMLPHCIVEHLPVWEMIHFMMRYQVTLL